MDLPGGDDPVVRIGAGQVVAQLGGGPEGAAHAGQVTAPQTGGLGLFQLLLHIGADGLPLLLGGEEAGDVFGEEGQGAHRQGAARGDGPVPVGHQLGGAAAHIGQHTGARRAAAHGGPQEGKGGLVGP